MDIHWSKSGRVIDGYGVEGIEGVLLILAQSTVRALLPLTPIERRRMAMQLTSLVLSGLDAAEGNHPPIETSRPIVSPILRFGEIVVDGVAVKLKPGTAAILSALMQANGKPVGWEQLTGACARNPNKHAVEVQVSLLKKALGDSGRRVAAVKGCGWAWRGERVAA